MKLCGYIDLVEKKERFLKTRNHNEISEEINMGSFDIPKSRVSLKFEIEGTRENGNSEDYLESLKGFKLLNVYPHPTYDNYVELGFTISKSRFEYLPERYNYLNKVFEDCSRIFCNGFMTVGNKLYQHVVTLILKDNLSILSLIYNVYSSEVNFLVKRGHKAKMFSKLL
jgi:hypothetical protein